MFKKKDKQEVVDPKDKPAKGANKVATKDKKETTTKPKRKATKKQKAALSKGQVMMREALELQKKGGSTTKTVTTFKLPLSKILKDLKNKKK